MLDLGFTTGAKVPLNRQITASEPALACLEMISNFYGIDAEFSTIRDNFHKVSGEDDAAAMMIVAEKLGITARGVKLLVQDIRKLHMPCALSWGKNNFVILEKVRGKKALIHNPAGHTNWISIKNIENEFSNFAIEFRVRNNFTSVESPVKLKLSQLLHNISGIKHAIWQIIILTLILECFVLISPFYMQISIDSVVPAQDQNLLTVLAIGFGLFTLINVASSLIRSFVILVAGATISFNVSTSIAHRLFRLPIHWFESRSVGDILTRFQSIVPIQQALTQGAVVAIIDGIFAIFTLIIMFFYNSALAFIAITAFTLYALTRLISFALQRKAQEASIIAHGNEQSLLIETLHSMTALRLLNLETLRHAIWQTRLVDVVNSNVRMQRIVNWQAAANALIFGLELIITVWISIGYVINGSSFSIGMVFAFMSYKGQFLSKAASLIDQIINFRMLGLHLERLSDIAMSKEDSAFDESMDSPLIVNGSIELRNITYKYPSDENMVLNNINLVIEASDYVAITGPSGGGKSTLVKILMGILEPNSGEILVDGVPLGRFGLRSYRDQVSVIMQEDNLFAGSIRDNITLFEQNPDFQRIIAAATAASMHDDIAKRPMQYDAVIGNLGINLSGGQKQRVLLARALYRRPKILIMDEGTAHLDLQHEQRVNSSISSLGITRIVVAHRAETLASAKRVYVLENGNLEKIR